MGLASTTVWEVRPTAGNDTNGGGFVSGGTDYSQQNSKNTSGSNISTADVVATGVATITSITANFSSAIVGNIIYLSGSGVTTGWYQVVTFSNSTTVILDRSPGTGTGITMNVGGALATLNVFSSAGITVSGNADGNTIWVRGSAGTLTITSTAWFDSNVNILGYGSTRGDGTLAAITTSTNSTALFRVNNNNYSNGFWNLAMTNTAGTPSSGFDNTALGDNTGQLAFINCTFSGFTEAVDGGYAFVVANAIYHLLMLNCEISACTFAGIRLYNPFDIQLIGCFIHDNSGPGIVQNGTGAPGCIRASRTVFYNNTYGVLVLQGGAQNATGVYCDNCAFVSNSNDGVSVTPGAGQLGALINCIFDSNGDYGVNVSGVGSFPNIYVGYSNAFYNNTSGARNNWPVLPGDVTLTGSPFNNPSGGDFTLNSTAGAGSSCKAAGYPSVLP